MNIRDNVSLPINKRKKYNLIPLEDTSKFLSSAFLCVKDFFKILRSSHELIYKIITKAEKKDFNNSSFIYFITNNFFNNILSSKQYSDDLLLLITHLLYDQISLLKNHSDFQKIFNNSNVFELLKGIKYKKDVQAYFELVLSDIIEEYENSENNSRPLVFKIDNLYDFIQNEETSLSIELNNSLEDKRKEIQKKQYNQILEVNKMFKMKLYNYDDNNYSNRSSINFISETENDESENKDSLESEIFLTKYMIELNKDEFIDILNKESNEVMKNFITDQLSNMAKDEKIYSNLKFLDEMQKSKETEKLLYNYQKNFNIVIDILSKIIKKFNDTVDLVPYTIKYLCKIICISLKKKFKNISNIEIYTYIGEFFFVFIFQEFFLNPDYGTLITSIIISKDTKINLLIIFEIWKKLISFKFFINNKEQAHFTPFNWFFLESINKIFNICEKILEFNLPEFLKNSDNDNELDYSLYQNNLNFNNSSFYSYSICYNIHNLTTLLNIIKNNMNYIFQNKEIKNEVAEFEVVFKNLKDKKDIFKNLKTNETETVNYYIYYEFFYSKKYQDILFRNINQENNFIIKEIKNPINEEQIYLNKIIRCKNLLCELLFKSENLLKIKFNKEKINYNNVEEIIGLLSQYYKNKSLLHKYYSKSANNDIDINYNDTGINDLFSNDLDSELNSLPLSWYSNTLLSCFKELNKDNNKIDYHEFFNQLKEEINNSINKYNFEELAEGLESLKSLRIHINNFIENQNKYKYININTKIRNFIENEKIDIEIKFRYNNESKIILISKTEEGINSKFQKLDEFLNQTKKDKVINCLNISDFIRKFPSLTSISRKYKIDVFLIEKEIRVKKSLLDYLKIVKEHIKKKFGKEEIDEVYSKIKKTLMVRLYDKLFPKKPDLEDISFYNQCLSLSWIEPKHLKQENLFFDNFLPITTSYFEQINNEKSASSKLEVISKIFDAINSVIIFNKGGNFSTDDIAPIFEYALIKAHPNRFSSNLKYLQIFMKKDEDLKERMNFDYLKAYMNIIKNATYSDFYDISEIEFNTKCQEFRNKLLNEKE